MFRESDGPRHWIDAPLGSPRHLRASRVQVFRTPASRHSYLPRTESRRGTSTSRGKVQRSHGYADRFTRLFTVRLPSGGRDAVPAAAGETPWPQERVGIGLTSFATPKTRVALLLRTRELLRACRAPRCCWYRGRGSGATLCSATLLFAYERRMTMNILYTPVSVY
jgi:hypothetical protein